MDRFKQPKHIVDASKWKRPTESASYFGRPVSFSFRKYDASAPWANTADSRPTVDSIFSNLRGYEGMTWGNVMQASGGRRHGTNSHHIPVNELSKEAMQRLAYINLEEGELFSLRLQGAVRLFGTIEPKNGCMFVIWYDPRHAVCPSVR